MKSTTAAFAISLFLLSSSTHAAQPGWYLFARDDGCVDLQVVVRKLHLPRAPESPEDFAQMMRERGEDVSLGMPDEFSSALAGKVVQVQFGDGRSLLFVSEEVCRKAESE